MSDLSRYARQIVLREVGVNGQTLLRDSAALVIGLGGLGSPVAQQLCGAGLGRLILSDFDRVSLSNLHRQHLYRETDVGRTKLEAAAASLAALNQDCALDLRAGPLDDAALLDAVRAADIVLDCSDNFPTRAAVNAACVAAKTPLVSGAAIRLEGQLALFDSARGGACYACVFPQTGDDAEGERCEEAGVLGPLVGTIGNLQALIALKHLLGIGDDRDRLHLFDARTLAWRSVKLARDPACAVCGHPSGDQ